MGRWVRIDRRYNQPYRLTDHAVRAIFKWIGLLVAWTVVNSWLAANHLGLLILATTGGMIWYGVRCLRRNTRPQLAKPSSTRITSTANERRVAVPSMPTSGKWQFNVPPNWPAPPPDWSPEPGWHPDPSWPPAPLHGFSGFLVTSQGKTFRLLTS